MHLLSNRYFSQLKGKYSGSLGFVFNVNMFSQREIELLKAEIKQPSDYQHVQVQTDEE
jgi:hypothetical protein